jgi:hypothetical protein
MSNGRSEREDRAFDALIVMNRLRNRDFNDLNDLPPLTESQRKLMESIPDDIVERMWNQAKADDAPCDVEENCEYAEGALEELEFAGMNRADDMDYETKKKLEEARKLVIEAMKAKKKKPKCKPDG